MEMEMDIVQRLRCVLKGNQDAQAAADEIKRLRAALHELADKTGELIEHLQATGRMSPCFNLPALDAARRALTPNDKNHRQADGLPADGPRGLGS